MNEYILTKPSPEYAEQIAAYRKEFLECGSSMDGCGPLRKMEDANEYIRTSLLMEDPAFVPPHLVPATQLLFIRTADQKLLGLLQIRHFLNDYLARIGGHIGYSIRPSERRKGYAKEMLRMALPVCRELGLERVMISCNEGNVGSEKTILANGGVYESTVCESDERCMVKKFWITL